MLTNPNDAALQQFINMAKQNNPQQVVMNLLQEKVRTGGPIFSNLLNLVQSGNYQQLEAVVRNMTKERGLDFDTEFNSFRRKFGL